MYVRRLELTDFRSYAQAAVDLEPGAERPGRAERLRQDQPRRGARLRGDPGQSPGRHRRTRWSGPAPPRAVDPLRDRARRTRAAGRAGDRAGQGEPGPARPLAGAPGPRRARRAAAGAVRPRGPGAGPRRPGRAPPLPRRPAGRPAAPVRRACAPTTSGCSSSATPCCARRTWPARPAAPGGGDLSTLDVWDTHLAQHGAELLAGRLELVRGARRRTWPRRTTRWPPGGARRGIAYRVAGAGRRATAGPGRAGGRRCSPRSPSARPAEMERGITLVGPHRDDLALDPRRHCPPRGTPATASPGRSRWRCGWPRTTCCAPTASSRCWCSTTSSPSWTPAAGSGWPSWSAGRASCWSPARCRRRAGRPARRPVRGRRGGGAPCRMSQAPTGRRRPGDPALPRSPDRRRRRPGRRRPVPPAAAAGRGRSWPGRCSTPRWPDRRRRRALGRAPGSAAATGDRRPGAAAARLLRARGRTRAIRSRSAPCWPGW